jgi:hypothetical protein
MTTTLSQRIRRDKIKITAKPRKNAPPLAEGTPMTAPGVTWWDVTLTMAGRQFTVPFHLGSAFWGKSPTALQVMMAMLADAAGIENYGMSEWLAEYFPDDDDRAAETYQAVSDQTARLRRFLAGLYDVYLWETDDN